MMDVNEDEWDYEYDDSETEDFYITLDLSNVTEKQNAQGTGDSARRSLGGHPVLLQSRLRHMNAVRRNEESAVNAASNTKSTSMGEMQITGLHTKNPLIVYNGQLLSCKWASTIGTDMFFVKPNPDAEYQEKPLRSLPSVDLLAISAVKLMANMASLRPRDEVYENLPDLKKQAPTQVDLTEDAQHPTGDNQATTQPVAEEQRTAPNNFLARLNQAKAKRGEPSRLMVSNAPDGARLMVAPGAEEPATAYALHEGPIADTTMEEAED